MAAGTFTVTATKTRTSVGTTTVTIVITCTGAGDFGAVDATAGPVIVPAPLIFSEGLPFGSAHIVASASPTSGRLWLGNDGTLANLVQVGVPHTTFPAIIDVTSGQNASTQTVAENLAGFPTLFHSYTFVAVANAAVITITECYMGTRG